MKWWPSTQEPHQEKTTMRKSEIENFQGNHPVSMWNCGCQILYDLQPVPLMGIYSLIDNSPVSGTTCRWLVGQRLDAKSNVCPTTVQSTSIDCPKTGHVESLSRHSPDTVRALSNLCQVPKHLDRDWTGKSRDCREPVHRS